MISIRILGITACALMLAPLHARPSVIVTLASVGDRVRAQNPDLKAARLRIREAAGRSLQSGRLANPEFETGIGHAAGSGEGMFEIGLTQKFPLTERLSLEKQVSEIEVRAAQAEVREVERRIVSEAREGVVKVLAIRQRRGLLERQAGLAAEFAARLSEIASRGEGSVLDAGQAKLEAAGLSLQLKQLDVEETAETCRIKPLLGMVPDESLLVSGVLPEVEAQAGGANRSRRPDLQAATLAAAAASQEVGLELAKRREDVEAGVFVGVERSEDAPEGYENEGIVGLKFRIPLPFWNKNEGNIQEATARAERKDLEARALARTIDLEIDGARREMAEWRELLGELDGNLIPLAEQQVALAEEAIRQGQGEIQSVFRNREKLMQLSAARLDALREYHLARVRHEAAKGSF